MVVVWLWKGCIFQSLEGYAHSADIEGRFEDTWAMLHGCVLVALRRFSVGQLGHVGTDAILVLA